MDLFTILHRLIVRPVTPNPTQLLHYLWGLHQCCQPNNCKEKGIFNSEVFPEGYKLSVARRDRQDVNFYSDQPDIRGGGTFVLVKDDIMAVRQQELETDCELTWTKFDIAGCKSVYVASFYRPHEND